MTAQPDLVWHGMPTAVLIWQQWVSKGHHH